MFKSLRFQLTMLYLLVGLFLIAVVGLGTYRLLSDYFQASTDLALQHKMAHEFETLGAPVPPALMAADRDWYVKRSIRDSRKRTAEPSRMLRPNIGAEEFFHSELTAIFVLPLNKEGHLLYDPNPYLAPLAPNTQAAMAALATGSDLRTVTLGKETRVRLLTFRLTRNDGPGVLQLGRILVDQDRILHQLLLGFLGLSGLSVIFLGAGSWLLAGRALMPAQISWERQQAFIASASHELRTPLAIIRASAEVVLRGLKPADSDRHELLTDVIQESDHMSRLVNDLLLLSRLDAQRLELEHKKVFLPDLLNNVYRQMSKLAEEQQITIQTGPLAGTIWGDSHRLHQVLLILLDNALRHTPVGGRITLETQPQGRFIQIKVQDTGSGIASEHLPHIFERFYQANKNETGGSGLGLSIAKALIKAQQGQIRLESQVGKGTQALLLLPNASETDSGHGLLGRKLSRKVP